MHFVLQHSHFLRQVVVDPILRTKIVLHKERSIQLEIKTTKKNATIQRTTAAMLHTHISI